MRADFLSLDGMGPYFAPSPGMRAEFIPPRHMEVTFAPVLCSIMEHDFGPHPTKRPAGRLSRTTRHAGGLYPTTRDVGPICLITGKACGFLLPPQYSGRFCPTTTHPSKISPNMGHASGLWTTIGRGVLKGRYFFLLRTALKDRPKGPPTANRQLPSTANRHQPPTTNRHQPLVTNRRQPPAATNRQLPTNANRLQPPTASHQRPPTTTNRHQPPVANCQPPTAANRQPPTATNHG